MIWSLSSSKLKLLTLNEFFIEFPNILFRSLFLSNFVTEVSFRVKVDWADVRRLKSSALDDILDPNPQFVIIFSPSEKYSKDNGPDW